MVAQTSIARRVCMGGDLAAEKLPPHTMFSGEKERPRRGTPSDVWKRCVRRGERARCFKTPPESERSNQNHLPTCHIICSQSRVHSPCMRIARDAVGAKLIAGCLLSTAGMLGSVAICTKVKPFPRVARGLTLLQHPPSPTHSCRRCTTGALVTSR